MIVGVITDTRTEDDRYTDVMAPTVYKSWQNALNVWCKGFNDLMEKIETIGYKRIYTEFNLEMAGKDENSWLVEWDDFDDKRFAYESLLTTAAIK